MQDFHSEFLYNRKLNVLLLEDSPEDAYFVEYHLRKLELPVKIQRVETKESYIKALQEFSPDIILSDYNLPAFNGLEALELKILYQIDVPFIFVTGFLGEERAVETLKKGAADFVLKGNLSKLPHIVITALREGQERKRRIVSELALQKSEAKYRQLVEQAADGIFLYDLNLHFLEVNSKACELLGYSKKELLQLSLRDIIPDGTISPEAAIWAMRAGETLQYESLRKRKDGTTFPTETSVTRTPDGFYQAIMRDISRRKKVENALNNALQRLEFHVENSPLAIMEFNHKGMINRWTKQAEHLFGWCEKEALGKHPASLKLIEPQDLEKIRKIVRTKIGGQSKHFTYVSHGYTKEGKKVYCEWYNSVSMDEKGRPESLLALVNDVTVRRVAEEANWEGQMQERKRIAREIHEGIGQMLVASKFKLASLDADHHFESKVSEMESLLEKTIEEARRISLNMAPRSVEQLGIEKAIRQLSDQIQRLTGVEITFHYVGQSHTADNGVLSSVYRLAQESLNNVIKHAHASKVMIELIQNEQEIKLEIADNGKGFKLSEKEFIQGSGLGNMKERVVTLGGTFQLDSTPQQGTRLLVKIPVVNPLELLDLRK